MHRILIVTMMLLGLTGLPAWAQSVSLTADPSTVRLTVTEATATGTFTVTAGTDEVTDVTLATEGLKNANGETVIPREQITIAPSGHDSLSPGEQLTVTVSLEELPPPGSYTGQITISHAAQAPEVVNLALEVKGLSYDPEKLIMTVTLSEGRASGEFTITAGDAAVENLSISTLGLQNAGGRPVVTPQQITLHPSSKDLLPAGEQLSITVSLGGLPQPDRYTGQISLAYEGQPEGSLEVVDVSLEIPGQVELSSDALLFRAPARDLPGLPFHFKPQEISIYTRGNYTYTLSVSAPQLAPKDDAGRLMLKNGAKGNLELDVCNRNAASGACKGGLLPFTSEAVGSGESTILIVQPGTLSHTGVYSGNLTLTFEPAGGGSAIVKTISVRAVASDGPLYPFLALVLGVLLVTVLVYSQETSEDRMRIQLRRASLTLRLSELVANAWDQAFSSRFADRIKSKLRDITYQWQSGAKWSDVTAKIDAIATEIDNLTEQLALVGSAEESLAQGKKEFHLTRVALKSQIAGEARLRQARIELGSGDTDAAKDSVKAAIKIYQEAFGRYSLMAFKYQEIQKAYERHPREFQDAWRHIEGALQRSDDRIDALELKSDAVQGEDEMERLDYWYRALQKVGDAIDHVGAATAGSGNTDDPQQILEQALALLGEATLENVRVPRASDSKDNLQKAEELAAAAVKLCKAAPWLIELWEWFPGNRMAWENHDEAWKRLNVARLETAKMAAGEDGNADTAVGQTREALVRLRLGELGRVAWRLPDGRQQVLEDAQAAADKEAWEAALQIVNGPWEESSMYVVEQLVEEWEIARGVDPDADRLLQEPLEQRQGLEAPEWIQRARKAMSATPVQEEMVRHLRFELEDLAQVDITAVPGAGSARRRWAEEWGALKAVLDAGSAQEKVARALLEECELVTHHPGHPGWKDLQDAHEALQKGVWAGGFWLARGAWLAGRPALAGFYIAEAARGIQGNDDPGHGPLARAKKARDDGRRNEAVRQARTAWTEAQGKLSDSYVQDAASHLAEWKDDEALKDAVKAAEEACAVKDKAQALRLAFQALATARLVAAENATRGKEDKLGYTAYRQARSLCDRGLYTQALQAAETAIRDRDAARPGREEQSQDPVLAKPGLKSARRELRPSQGDLKFKIAVVETKLQALREAPANWLAEVQKVLELALQQPAGKRPEDVRASLDKAERMLDFLADEHDAIQKATEAYVSPKDPGHSLLESARALFAQGNVEGAGKSLERARSESEAWRRSIITIINEAELRSRNQGLRMEDCSKPGSGESAGKDGGFPGLAPGILQDRAEAHIDRTIPPEAEPRSRKQGPRTEGKDKLLGGGSKKTDRGTLGRRRDRDVAALDGETSVDDLFAFEVRLKAADLAGYRFEWYVIDDPGNPWDNRSRVDPVLGRADNQLVRRFNNSGKKEIKVVITHQDVSDARGEVCRSFVVEPSRYRALLRVKRSEAITEGVMVVALASLIGLGVVYYGQGVESFGSGADYLAAFVYGATAKTAQEMVTSLPDWMKKLLGKTT